jgi:hypothetical protein
METYKRAGCLLFFSLFSCVALAQNTTGSLSGTVKDLAGAVVAGAKVEIISQSTGVVTPLTTNNAGVYRAAFLIPGSYKVRIRSAGFTTFEATGVEVELAREPNVNAVLQVGDVGQTVEIQETAQILNTDSAQLSTNVQADSLRIELFPPAQVRILA